MPSATSSAIPINDILQTVIEKLRPMQYPQPQFSVTDIVRDKETYYSGQAARILGVPEAGIINAVGEGNHHSISGSTLLNLADHFHIPTETLVTNYNSFYRI